MIFETKVVSILVPRAFSLPRPPSPLWEKALGTRMGCFIASPRNSSVRETGNASWSVPTRSSVVKTWMKECSCVFLLILLWGAGMHEKSLVLEFISAVWGTFRHRMEKGQRKSNLRLIFQKNKIKNAQKCVKMTDIFGKVRKALGNVSALTSRRDLFSREARAEQVNLIKVGAFSWFLRNSRNTPLSLLTGLKTTPFSDVTAGCATIFGHVRISPFLSFLRISVRFFCFGKMSFRFNFLLSFPTVSRKVPRPKYPPLWTQPKHWLLLK